LATEADDVLNNNLMDLHEGYIDVEDPQPSQDPPKINVVKLRGS
jgi:hypothetical protein